MIGSPEYQYTAVGERSGFMLVPRCREHRAGAESLLPRIVYLGASIDNDVLPPVAMPAGDQYSTVRKSVAVCDSRATAIDLTGVKRPIRESYTSTDERNDHPSPTPPTMRTVPSRSSVAVCPLRPTFMAPAGVNREVRESTIVADVR